MASEDFNKIQEELWKLRAEFNLFRQRTEKNIYSNLIVFIKKVLFKGSTETERDGLRYNLVPTFVELAGGGAGGISTGTWDEWDLSAYIPVGAVMVEVWLTNRQDTAYISGLREKGSSIDRISHISNYSQMVMTANLDADRIVERWSNNGNVTFTIRGYWI